MNLTLDYEQNTGKQWGTTWIAKVTDWPHAKIPHLEFGRYQAGTLEIVAQPGDVIRFGQKNTRHAWRSVSLWGIVTEDGGVQPVEEKAARAAWKMRETTMSGPDEVLNAKLVNEGMPEGIKSEIAALKSMQRVPVKDMLRAMFLMQKSLNNKIFAKHCIRGTDGEVLTMDKIIEQANMPATSMDMGTRVHSPQGLPNTWLVRYLKALNDESEELEKELLWKWWSKDDLNMQNIRVEIIDQLHFWMSMAMAAGLEADDVYRIYMQKHEVNEKRQEDGYSAATKSDDNSQIK